MKQFILLTVLLAIAIYHIKTTDYTLTTYLIQIGLALLTYRVYMSIKLKRFTRKELPK